MGQPFRIFSLPCNFCREGLWKPELLDKVKFTSDLIICQPDVTELALAEGDEFLILATDGLW